MENASTYMFIVDTKAHAAMFEKALFAFVTGQYFSGYSKYARSLRKITRKKNSRSGSINRYFEDHLLFKDYYPSPNPAFAFCIVGLRSVGITFKKRPIDYVLNLMVHRAFEFCKNGRDNDGQEMKIPFVGCRLVKTTEVQEVETLA